MNVTIASDKNGSVNRQTVAYTIYAEARGEENLGMCYVASVIYNRSQERNMTAWDVCKQKRQFASWNVARPGIPVINNDTDRAIWQYCLILSNDIIEGKFKPFCKSNHFYNPNHADPSWAESLFDSFMYKRHRFGRI